MKLSKLNIILIIVSIIAVATSIFLIEKANATLKPDYAPGVIDKNAVPLPDDGVKNKASDGGGAVSLTYSNNVYIDLEKKEVSLYFQNPSKSTHNMALYIIINQNDKETIIAKSNMLPVGNALYKLDLMDNIKLVEGGYNGKFRIVYYDEKTEEMAAINTEIPIKIAVE